MMMNYLREVGAILYFLLVINMDWFNIIKNLDYTYQVDAFEEETDVIVSYKGHRVGYLYSAHLPLLIEKFKTAKILDLHLNPQHRGKGIGRKMYDKLLANLPIGVENLYGEWQDESSKSFWKHMGFEIKDKRIGKKIK